MKVSLRLFLFFLFLPAFCFSTLAQRRLQATVDYITKYSSIAVEHKNKYKIPASITLAQAILESGSGGSELSKASNNHFGIKCHSDWKGERIYRKDDILNECFRKYKSAKDSYEDHAKFLRQHSRYAVLFTYDINDYRAWAKGLQSCGYATNKGYANKLIWIIEEYELYKYDTKTSSKNTTSSAKEKIKDKVDEKEKKKRMELHREIFKTFNLIYVIAQKDDSFDQIAKDTGFKIADLIKFNEVPEDFPLKKDDRVYLQPKKKKADKPYFEHLVKVGDSMHSISQRYGIQLKYLYDMNAKDPDYVPTEGEVLRLR